MGVPLKPDPRREWLKRRRRRKLPALITMQSLARLADLDSDEILDRIKRGHIAPLFATHEATALLVLLRRERSRRLLDWDDTDPETEH